MTSTEIRGAPLVEGATLNLQWGPIVAGAITAAAVALILHSFAIAIGLAVGAADPHRNTCS
jgi:hypothetical protein